MEFNKIKDFLQNYRVEFFSYNKNAKVYEGVSLGEDGNVTDADFLEIITRILSDNNITIISIRQSIDDHKKEIKNLDWISLS